MCGIAGVIFFNNRIADKEMICKMTCAMGHRGPDADSSFIEGQVALGHRRLSIIDLSDVANQPFADRSGRYQLIFNGELYNFKEVKEKLRHLQFRTNSDTEVLAEAYAAWGPQSLEHFKGMFVFAVWDRSERKLFIARDRMGVKPLYYYYNDDFLIFSSEIRSILASGLIKRKLNKQAVYDYLQYQSVSSPISIVEGIQQLEAGYYMEVHHAKVSFKQYWNIAALKENRQYDKNEIQQRIYDLLYDSVQQRLISDVPIGAFLSGGIDSSVIVALMAEVSNSKPKTFVIGFKEKEYDESDYAEIIAKKFHTDHQRILLSPDIMLRELTNALNAMDTPSGDGINTYVVSKEIKKSGITVALSGIGGDELFAGYPFFTRYAKLKKKQGLWKSTGAIRHLLALCAPNAKYASLFRAPSANIEDIYPVLRQVLSDSDILRLTSIQSNPGGIIAEKLRDNRNAIRSFPLLSQVSIAEYMGYTQQTLLRDTDQMSMAVSLEVREPFFDHELVEYVLSIEDKFKYPVYPKKLLIESMKGLLPNEIVHRKKQGFVFPWNHWLKTELKDFCSLHIQRMAERDFINGKEVIKLWNNFNKGNTSIRWLDVWLFVILEYWLEKNGIE